jgi:hypothetical protein
MNKNIDDVSVGQASDVDAKTRGAGWLISPLGGNTSLLLSQQDVASGLTPEMVKAIESELSSLKNAKMMTHRDCNKLASCGNYVGKCPNLASCDSYQ